MNEVDLTMAIVGSGGEGAISAGEILVRATAKDGLFGMIIKEYGPQIRVGECMARVRLRNSPVLSLGDFHDSLVVLSWNNFYPFSDEILFHEGAIVLHDSADPPPAALSFPEGVRFFSVPLTEIAKKITSGSVSCCLRKSHFQITSN